ncbi:DUF4893 domain-containing protein [Sphingomonas sp. CJ20]
MKERATMKWMLPVTALSAMLVSGCSVYREATSARPPTDVRWERIATDSDRNRIRNWRKTWDLALPLAKQADGGAIARDPALFDPDRALGDASPPQGAYRCRMFKLGANGTATRDFSAYPAFDCEVVDEGPVKSMRKTDGPQRPSGLLYPDSNARAIFLGTMVYGDETAALRYGIDSTRDIIGYVERIAPRRWRMVFPSPSFESLLDIVELVPAS